MKKIRDDSFIFKTAYWFYETKPMGNINFCKLCRDFVLGLLLGGIVWFILFLCYLFGFIIGFFTARRPAIFKTQEDLNSSNFLIFYNHWPKIGGKRVYPIVIIGLAALVYFHSYIIRFFVWFATVIVKLITSHAGVLFFASVTVLMFLVFCFRKFKKSETYGILREYVKAKKSKICPEIEIVKQERMEK